MKNYIHPFNVTINLQHKRIDPNLKRRYVFIAGDLSYEFVGHWFAAARAVKAWAALRGISCVTLS